MSDASTPAAPTLTPWVATSVLTSLQADLASIGATAKSLASTAKGDGAALLTAIHTVLAPLETQLGNLIAGQAMTPASKFELLLVAQLHDVLPGLIKAAEVAASSEVVAMGAKLAVAEGVTAGIIAGAAL